MIVALYLFVLGGLGVWGRGFFFVCLYSLGFYLVNLERSISNTIQTEQYSYIKSKVDNKTYKMEYPFL